MTGLRPLEGPILVVGAYGYRNVGDEAILAGLLARLEGQAVTVVSRTPAETAAMHGVRAIGIQQAVPALRRHRSVVIGGGGLFGRDMGRIGRLLPAFGLLAAGLGRTVVVDGVDVDAQLSGSTRFLLPPLLRRAHRVSVRDASSAAAVSRWGVVASQQPDLSAWMQPATSEAGLRALDQAGLSTDQPIVGLALTAVDPQLGQRAIEAVAAAMDALPDVRFCFVPMSQHPWVAGHNDLLLARRLAALRPELSVLGTPLPPATMLACFGHLAAVVAMRYHAMLFAERAGVPLVPVTYAPKTQRWLATHELAAVEPSAARLTRALKSALGRSRPKRRPAMKVAS
jgi:polysaccharide pyruvyl transferase WcaK-like protein